MDIEKIFKKRQRFQKKLSKHQPNFICLYCGKILYPKKKKFIKLKEIQKEERLRFIEHYLIKSYFFRKIDEETLEEKFSFCLSCSDLIKNNAHKFCFNDSKTQSPIPQVITDLKHYKNINSLSLCNLYCNTFQRGKFSYWHFSGRMNIVTNKEEQLKGTFGTILADDPNNELYEKADMTVVKPALVWLWENNPLYEQFVPNIERIDGYYSTTQLESYYNGFPLFNDPKTSSINLLREHIPNHGIF